MTTKVFAPAKVNLTLHITGQRDDGYHLLDSLVVFVDVGDELRVSEAAQMSLYVSGPYAQGVPDDASNLVWRAAELCGLRADITLEKHLPNAAGIGGGSADAAAVVRAARSFGHEPKGDVATLGADVPVCMSSAPQRMSGIGEVLAPSPKLPQLWMVLVNPMKDVPTPAVFQALKQKVNPAMEATLPGWKDAQGFCEWLAEQRNDLEAPAVEAEPIIGAVLGLFPDALLARMSGSGATCFGLYADAQSSAAAAARIRQTHPEWWVADAKVLDA
jgi:4-diphosphocytidyl-2-C-methyl-D-erythritol kinase